ncbi:putative defense protein [Pomacea canaliculata]|uniref:putative defense protein n=1 Tax=Pomacea canaliculata TaxID=400727 RepID=UPI000D73E169|nr:putative defense protein [Pomacea canaliculata]
MKTPVLMPMLFPLVVLLSCCGPSLGYSTGPPTSACTDMYPEGHNADAQTTILPFELLVSNTTFTPNAKIVVTLQVKSSMPTMFFKGMFVQARLAGNCSNTSPVGTFSIPTGDTYLQLLSCGQLSSSISHKNSLVQIHSKNFTWTAPSTATGRIFFRATVVKSKQEFWTNVFSPYVKPVSDTSSPPTTGCEVRKTLVQTSTPASSSYKTSSTVSSSTRVSSTLTTRTTTRLTTKRTTSLYTSGTSIISPARLLAAVACVIALAARV